jgi:hypothetical protein
VLRPLPSIGRYLQSNYLTTAVFELIIPWSLPRSRPIRHTMLIRCYVLNMTNFTFTILSTYNLITWNYLKLSHYSILFAAQISGTDSREEHEFISVQPLSSEQSTRYQSPLQPTLFATRHQSPLHLVTKTKRSERDSSPTSGVGNCFGSGATLWKAEVGGGPHLLKWLHSLVNFAFQKRYKLFHKNQ